MTCRGYSPCSGDAGESLCRAGRDRREAHKGPDRLLDQRHGALSDGGTLVLVSECEGVIKGFVIGILDRVYHIGTKLMATDLFTFNSPDGDPRDGLRLIDGLIAWAESNHVIEIKLGAVDAVGDFERTAKVFRRRGLKQSGVIYQGVSSDERCREICKKVFKKVGKSVKKVLPVPSPSVPWFSPQARRLR